MKDVTDYRIVRGLMAFAWASLFVSGAVLFEEGQWVHTVIAWGFAVMVYGLWRYVRVVRRREAR